MSNKIEVAVYGSLRLEMYNYDRFKEHFGDGFEYERTIVTSGFALYDLGSYPCAVKTDKPSDVLIVDIIKVSEECKYALDIMEFGAGYIEGELTNGNKKYPIYIYKEKPTKAPIVPSGDWVVYKKK